MKALVLKKTDMASDFPRSPKLLKGALVAILAQFLSSVYVQEFLNALLGRVTEAHYTPGPNVQDPLCYPYPRGTY